jgi:hypothetical protein
MLAVPLEQQGKLFGCDQKFRPELNPDSPLVEVFKELCLSVDVGVRIPIHPEQTSP